MECRKKTQGASDTELNENGIALAIKNRKSDERDSV